MSANRFNEMALEQKARSERLYLHYALALASALFLGGLVLTMLGVGEHVDIVVKRGDLEARFVNATPGIAMTLIGAMIFAFSKPRRLNVKSSTTKTETTPASPPAMPNPAIEEFSLLSEAGALLEAGEYDSLRRHLERRRVVILALLGNDGMTKLYSRIDQLIDAREKSLNSQSKIVVKETREAVAYSQPATPAKKAVTYTDDEVFYQGPPPKSSS